MRQNLNLCFCGEKKEKSNVVVMYADPDLTRILDILEKDSFSPRKTGGSLPPRLVAVGGKNEATSET